jgi:hypothetical protein
VFIEKHFGNAPFGNAPFGVDDKESSMGMTHA